MKPTRIFAILFLALLLSCVSTERGLTRTTKPQMDDAHMATASNSAGTTANRWTIDCVDCSRQFWDITDRSLRLDEEEHPHIAYGGDHLYYTWYDGTLWHYETVDTSLGVGHQASLVLDESGLPHISYRDIPNHTVKHAWHDGATWHIEAVAAGCYPALALDNAGRPRISYFDDHVGDLRYAWHDGTAWHTETVDSEGYVGLVTSLEMDNAGRPHISYKDGTNDNLKYAWYDGASWHTEIVDSVSNVGFDNSLALDSSGQPRISYRSNTNLKYAWYDGANWNTEIVDSVGDALYVYGNSLALDGSGQPYISYYDSTSDILKYARHDGTGWQTEVVDSEGSNTSLTLDASEQPHIIYYGSVAYTGGDLKYVWNDGVDWQIETLDNSEKVGGYNSVAVDKSGKPHVSYYDATNYALKYAWNDGTAWHTETVDSGGEGTSLALDESGHPHIGYFSNYPHSRIKYAWHDGTNWYTETAGYRGVERQSSIISLALDGSGQPHIVYEDFFFHPYGGTHADLLYARRYEAGEWNVETIASSYVTWLYPALALDSAGQPHISYNYQGLKHAWHDEIWHIETVDSGESYRISLALDKADRPHIGYTNGDGQLQHAWHDGKDWRIEKVDSEGGRTIALALAMDESDRPRISYRYDAQLYGIEGLKHAWYDGAGWHREMVKYGGVGYYSSLAVDLAGRSHISYGTGNNLEYALMTFSLDKQVAPDGNVQNQETLTFTLSLAGSGHDLLLSDPLPPTIDYVPGSITSTIAPPATYSPTIRSVLWRGSPPTYTIQTIRFQAVTNITATGALSSPVQIANTAWLTDTVTDSAVSSTDSITVLPAPLSLGKEIDPINDLQSGDTLTFTLTISGSRQTVHLWDPLPASVEYVTDSITGTVTPPATYSPTTKAIVWDGTIPTDTVLTIRFQATAKATKTEVLPPIANTAWLTCTSGVESGRSISTTAVVNTRRFRFPLILHRAAAVNARRFYLPLILNAVSKPDDFGYTWSDSVALNWVDATDGTDTGMSGLSSGQRAGPIDLPFPFRYYENTYNSLYIAASGYLAFTDEGSWSSYIRVPSPAEPNTVIAPCARYFSLASNGPTNRVYYKSGGTAPDRYFVAEWYQVGSYGHTFEVILQEKGDIVFQYQTMTPTVVWDCSAIGIEDSAGLDGLSYREYGQRVSPNEAVHFYRPVPSARVGIRPLYYSKFTHADEAVSFEIPVRNIGDLGSDTYDVLVSSNWPVSLYNAGLPLTDTDGDGAVDTGNVVQGSVTTITAKVKTPATAKVGSKNMVTTTIRSSLDTSRSKILILQTAVPGPFAQVYRDEADGAMSLDLVRPDAHTRIKTTVDEYPGYNIAVAEMPNGFVYVWNTYSGLEYTLRDNSGNAIQGVSKLTDNSPPYVGDGNPAVAVAPNGNIGVIWRRHIEGPHHESNYNIYYAILKPSGDLVVPPTNLTNVPPCWESGCTYRLSLVHPRIAATDDNRFMMAWERKVYYPDYYYSNAGWLQDIYYTIRGKDGSEVKGETKFTDGVTGSDGYETPALTALDSNRALLAYTGPHGITYAVLDSAGNTIKEKTVTGRKGYRPDAVQLSGGDIVIAWEENFEFVIIDGTTYETIHGPNQLHNLFATAEDTCISIAADEANHAILTWINSDWINRSSLYYALIDGNGNVLTDPMIFRTSQAIGPSIVSNCGGYGNTSYSLGAPTSGDVLNDTLAATGPASNVRWWDPLPRDVSYITDSITSTIAPPAVYSTAVEAIAWQGAPPTSTVQTIRFLVIVTGGALLSPAARGRVRRPDE